MEQRIQKVFGPEWFQTSVLNTVLAITELLRKSKNSEEYPKQWTICHENI